MEKLYTISKNKTGSWLAKIMASGPITSCQVDWKTVETVADFIFMGSKITADGDCSHEIKRRLLLGRKDAYSLGADCGSDHELLIAKFRLKLKKIGKTTWPFRYDLNQILYGYTVEVTNTLKGLALIDRQRFKTLYRRQWSRLSPRKRNAKRQNGCQRRPCK